MAANGPAAPGRSAALRVRIGLGLVVFSWLPIAQIVIWMAGWHNAKADEFRVSVWVAQWVIGLIGLVVAGQAVAQVVRHAGWRHTPTVLWRMMRTGGTPAG